MQMTGSKANLNKIPKTSSGREIEVENNSLYNIFPLKYYQQDKSPKNQRIEPGLRKNSLFSQNWGGDQMLRWGPPLIRWSSCHNSIPFFIHVFSPTWQRFIFNQSICLYTCLLSAQVLLRALSCMGYSIGSIFLIADTTHQFLVRCVP